MNKFGCKIEQNRFITKKLWSENHSPLKHLDVVRSLFRQPLIYIETLSNCAKMESDLRHKGLLISGEMSTTATMFHCILVDLPARKRTT